MELTTVYMAEVNAMPIPSTRTTPRVNPRCLINSRPAKRPSCSHALQPWCDPDVAHVIAGERQVAQRAPGRGGRSGTVQPGRLQFPLLHFQVEPQLVVELSFVMIAL